MIREQEQQQQKNYRISTNNRNSEVVPLSPLQQNSDGNGAASSPMTPQQHH
jgi:hypothetical protein